jgi:hypothetical protein
LGKKRRGREGCTRIKRLETLMRWLAAKIDVNRPKSYKNSAMQEKGAGQGLHGIWWRD